MLSRVEAEYRYEKLTWPEIDDAVDMDERSNDRKQQVLMCGPDVGHFTSDLNMRENCDGFDRKRYG